MKLLDPDTRPDILLTYDSTVGLKDLSIVKSHMLEVCRNWGELTYPVPPKSYFAPNWAFQCTAQFIARTMRRPWLWFEADMTPLKPGWFRTLEQAYRAAAKPCMGVLVPGMGHMNGTGIYPFDYAHWAKNAMTCIHSAWDTEQLKDLAGGKVKDASPLMQHVWGIIGGKPHPSQGPPPHFKTARELNWLDPRAVTFHRCKDSSLIDRLRERKK